MAKILYGHVQLFVCYTKPPNIIKVIELMGEYIYIYIYIYAAYVAKKEELRSLCVIVEGKEQEMGQLGKYKDISTHERIILKWISKKQNVVVYWIHMDRNRPK